MWPCLRLHLSPWRPNQQIACLRLAWNPAGDAPRQELIEHLSLPVLPAANRARKRLSKEATRSSLDVWDADDGTI